VGDCPFLFLCGGEVSYFPDLSGFVGSLFPIYLAIRALRMLWKASRCFSLFGIVYVGGWDVVSESSGHTLTSAFCVPVVAGVLFPVKSTLRALRDLGRTPEAPVLFTLT